MPLFFYWADINSTNFYLAEHYPQDFSSPNNEELKVNSGRDEFLKEIWKN